MKLQKIVVSLFVLILVTNFITAQEFCVIGNNCTEDEKLKCENFYWVENYIMNATSNATSNQLQLIDFLKSANYAMQGDLNNCTTRLEASNRKLGNQNVQTIITIFSMIIASIAIVWVFILSRRNFSNSKEYNQDN